MSQAVKTALLATKDLGKNERAVVIAIAAHANQEGDAWPSVATIANYVGCSARTVQRTLVKLVNLGRLIVRQVAGIATRVYRLVLGPLAPQRVTQGAAGVTDPQSGVTNQPAGGDSQNGSVSPEVGKSNEKLKRAGARDWRRFIPKNKNTTPGYPERKGAALPPPPGGDRCQKSGHVGQLVGRCAPCRSEALGVSA